MSAKGLVLLYHRVHPVMPDPQLLMVRPERFEAHLETLSRTCAPLPLAEMLRLAARDALPPRAVAVTFDDGYADNALYAKPLLERRGVPATVFAVSGMVGAEREFWWDELERLTLTPGTLPGDFALTAGGETLAFALGPAATYGPDEARAHAGWNVLMKEDPSPRHGLYRQLYVFLRRLDEAERFEALERVRHMAGFGPEARETHRPLRLDELRSLAEGPMTTVGAHTVRHARLSQLAEADQREEIARSRARLEELLGAPVREFSYPFGGRTDYDAFSVRAARESGCVLAVSNFAGLVGPQTDPWQIPRHIVRDVTAETLGESLDAWFAAGEAAS